LSRGRPALALAAAALLLLGACDNIKQQARNKAYSKDTPMVMPPDGTVSRDPPDTAQPPLTLALIERGHERFDIYCAPCHGRLANGHGMIVARGFPQPPDFHSDRLRSAPTSHFYDVITNGFGVMYPYGGRVPPQDRWAIAAYIRALQESQHVAAADLTPAEREKLQ
jgi:mono/diheme cytochrome c family protein